MQQSGGRINLKGLRAAAVAISAILLLGAGGSRAFGQCMNSLDDAWVGGASGDWSVSANWSAGEPSSTCDVFIQSSGAAVLMDVSGSTGNLTLGTGNSLTLPAVTNTNNSLVVAGSVLSNGGQILLPAPFLNFGGTSLLFSSGGTVTLSGGGTVTLSANTFGSDDIGNYGSGANLSNQETIQGSGSLDMTFDNASTGVINANQSGVQLVVGRNQNLGSSTNTGLIEATGGGQLALGSLTLNNVGGTVEASGTNSLVLLQSEGQGGETFTGGTWTTSSGGLIQSLDYTVIFDGTGGNTVTNSGTLQLVDGASHPGGNFQGAVNNTGTIQVLSKGSGVDVGIPSGQTLTLTGKGNLTLGDGTNNSYNNNDGITGGTLINQQLIQGTGAILNLTSFTNSSGATINDNVPVGSANLQLQLGRAGASTNSGTIEASNGGGLVIGSTTITNTNGTIEAVGANSYVELIGSLGTSGLTISGGTYTTSGGGTIYAQGGTLLDGTGSNPITNSGLILDNDAGNNPNAQIQGNVTNTGTIQITSNGDPVSLCIPGGQTLTLSGAGTLTMGDGTSNVNNNQVLLGCALGGGGTLINEQTIQGAGSIGGITSITNMGTINANDPIGANNVELYLSAQGTPVTNTNVIEATNGGALQINVPVTNTNGEIQAVGAGSYVQLYGSNAVLTGGTLTTSLGGTIYADAGASISTATNSGTLVIQDNNSAIFSGTITNTGTISVGSTGDNTTLAIPSGQTTTFTGSGSVSLTMNTNNNDSVIAATQCSSATLVNSSGHTIEGTGTVFPNTNCFSVLTNNGTINANQTSGPLVIEAANLTNTGTLEATSGAQLQLTATNITNTGSTITASGSGSVVQLGSPALNQSMTLTGGTLTTSGGGLIYAEHNSTLTGFTNTGTLTVPDSNNVTFSGTVTNNGTINLSSAGNSTTLVIPAGGTLTLAGTGTLALSNESQQNVIASSNCSNATFNNQSTIQGSGTFFPNGNCYGTMTNSGTINANLTGNNSGMYFNAVNFNNTGTLSVASGGFMTFPVRTSAFLNLVSGTNGYTLTGGSYSVTGTLQIPGDVYANAANVTLTGASALIEDMSGVNVFSALASNSSTGSLTLSSGAALSTTANFTNSGVLNLSPGTLNVTGSFTQSGTFDVSVGGAAAGAQYGQVKASGTASVGGTLNIALINGYIPALGATFTILTGATRTGAFATVNGTTISSTEHFDVNYTATSVTLTVASTGTMPWADSPTGTVDFYGDGKGEPALWRPSTGTWYVLANGGGGNLTRQWGTPGDIPATGDYDGDGKDDFAVFRPSNGTWYIIPSGGGNTIAQQWGIPDDVPVPADYDGDGKTDVAVWRPSNGTFYVILSSTGKSANQQWGAPGDVPVRGDYDGDGKNDYAVFRPSNGTWYVILSSTGKSNSTAFGTAGDIPAQGDYDGDGKTDFAVWRPDTTTWWVSLSSTGQTTSQQWGALGDVPVVGDYNGDGKNDYAVFRPSNGTWYFDYAGGGTSSLVWGTSGDIPATRLASIYQHARHIANFDGDQKADIGVFRPSSSTWYVINSSTGRSVSQALGASGDLVVPGDYDGDGKTDYGVWRPSNQTWYVILSSTDKQVTQVLGTSGDVPVPGDYDGDGKTDYATFRPSDGTWYVILSSTGKQVTLPWGASGDIPVPADYDGDGRTDYAIWRPSTQTWWVILSSTGKSFSQQLGESGDIPVPGDYDGDTKVDYTVFRPSTGTWYTIESSTGKTVSTLYGTNGDIPVAKDYDGDNKTDIAVFRPSTGTWYVLQSSNGKTSMTMWGLSADVPVNKPTGSEQSSRRGAP